MMTKWIAGIVGITLLAAAMELRGATLIPQAFFKIADVPGVLNTTLKPKQNINFRLEENGSTGYCWSVTHNPSQCTVNIEHRASDQGMVGVPGYAELNLIALKDEPFTIELNYSRPWEKDVKPFRTVKICVNGYKEAGIVVPVKQNKIPMDTQFIHHRAFYRLSNLPTAVQVALAIGQDISFSLQEKPEEKLLWRVGSYDPAHCRIELTHREGGFFSSPKAQIKIEQLAIGLSVVEFYCSEGDQAKVFKVFVAYPGYQR